MRTTIHWTLGVTFATVLAVTASADSGRRFVVTDDCAPNADWGPNGCLRASGDVTRAEFAAANAKGHPGHPSWRIVPPYVARADDGIRVRNTGGRGHTFTEVASFGGGFVAVLNAPGSALAPECAIANPDGTPRSPAPQAQATMLAPGAELRVEGLAPGTHNFQCCIHPWMRTVVKVRANDDDGDR
jgi:hypothetical protein